MLSHATSISVCLILFIGCQSTSKEPRLPILSSHTTFEDFRNEWPEQIGHLRQRLPNSTETGLEKLAKICDANEGLCERASQSKAKNLRYSKARGREFLKSVEAGDWSEVADYNVAFALDAFQSLKAPRLFTIAEKMPADSCSLVDARHGLAATLENFLPSLEARRWAIELFEQNTRCGISKTSAQSAYRAGMLRVLEDRCDAAVPLLKNVLSSTEDYLKSRALYWTWNCLGQPPEFLETAQKQMPYFSYHGLLMSQFKTLSIIQDADLKDKTPFLQKSKIDEALNQVIPLVEEQLAKGDSTMARVLLEKINVERIQKVEPGFRIYWAFLMHLSQTGVKKFQILGKLINDDSQFRSKSVKSMLFPTWYFESVASHSSLVDPWLIQSLIRQESAFDPRARSRVGATGLMQLMPATARRMAKINRHQLKDPEQNLKLGVRFFENLLGRYDGEIHLALAAYNAGPGKVDSWIKRYPTGNPLLFADVIPYRETREYVAFILRNYYWYQFLNGQQTTEMPLLLMEQSEITAVE